MTQQRVLQFDHHQSLVQESDRSGWSENVCVSVRLFSEAITSGWYRIQFAGHGNDFVILLAIAMHARPLKGDDLTILVNLQMATIEDEGRLYARVSDIALADELGMNRMTIARAERRLAEQKSIDIVEIPEKVNRFRDSHGYFSGNKVFLIAGDIQRQFLEKKVENLDHAVNSCVVALVDDSHHAINSRTVGDHHAPKSYKPAVNSCINMIDEEDDEEGKAALTESIFSYFARRKGDLDFEPTIKEKIALEKLINDGFSSGSIIAGIEAAFTRPSRPRYFTHCAAIARDLIRFQQESRTPETCESSARKPENLEEMDQKGGITSGVIESHLLRVVDIYRSSGREITNDLLVRFRLMASRCDQAAHTTGATGGDWLADALTCALGVAHPRNVVNYADAVLSDWISKGTVEKQAQQVRISKPTQCRSNKADREPAAHTGIRQYLEKHGGIANGNRD